MADNIGNLGENFNQGLKTGYAIGGKKAGLGAALAEVVKNLQAKDAAQAQTSQETQLLGVKGLMSGETQVAQPGEQGSFSVQGLQDSSGKPLPIKSVGKTTAIIDPDSGKIIYSIPKNSKFKPIKQGLSQDDITVAAQALVDGREVPSQLSGFSKQKQAVIDKSMQIDKNYNPAKADMDFAVTKMGAGAFAKNFNNLDSFHQDFELNSDYLLSLSKNFDRSTIPLLNKALVSGANEIQGNPKATQILQAVNTVANGYARLQNPTLSGQALSDAARKESQDLVNGFQSDAQMKALLDPQDGSMRIDANNRITAATNVMKRLQGITGGQQVSNSGTTDYKSKYGLQ
jgi:hypothetical protein